MKIPQSVRVLLSKALNPDGGPQIIVVWVGIENETAAVYSGDPTAKPLTALSRSVGFADNSANAEISAAFSIGSLGISEGYAWSSPCYSALVEKQLEGSNGRDIKACFRAHLLFNVAVYCGLLGCRRRCSNRP